MNKNFTILHLSLINGIGPSTIKQILDNKFINFSDLYNLKTVDFQSYFNLSNSTSTKIFNGLQSKKLLDDELALIEKNNIKWFTFEDDLYPYLLKNIHLPPAIIYLQGNIISDSTKIIAIIGSRKATDYGYKSIDKLVRPLIKNNWVIASGGAIGADTMAHQITLREKGKTIAILGSGLLHPYPYCNKKMFEKIIESEGTILSPFPLTTQPFPGNFPSRNRIISGISRGCIIIQAGLKSGTRITAMNALEQGREVFAVPGPIDDELSLGCHKLIQEGAKLIYCAQDILQEFGEASEFVEDSNENLFDSIDCKIISICKVPNSIEELIEKTGLSLNDLQCKLFELQLDGKIQQNFAGLWEKI